MMSPTSPYNALEEMRRYGSGECLYVGSVPVHRLSAHVPYPHPHQPGYNTQMTTPCDSGGTRKQTNNKHFPWVCMIIGRFP